jgi:hypothetical protein
MLKLVMCCIVNSNGRGGVMYTQSCMCDIKSLVLVVALMVVGWSYHEWRQELFAEFVNSVAMLDMVTCVCATHYVERTLQNTDQYQS